MKFTFDMLKLVILKMALYNLIITIIIIPEIIYISKKFFTIEQIIPRLKMRDKNNELEIEIDGYDATIRIMVFIDIIVMIIINIFLSHFIIQNIISFIKFIK